MKKKEQKTEVIRVIALLGKSNKRIEVNKIITL